MGEAAATPIVAGSFYWLELEGKRRPVVVLEVREQRALVIVGSTKQRSRVRVTERPTTRQGRSLGLSKTTYFYHDNLYVVDFGHFRRVEGKPCPPNLLLEIRTLLQEFPEAVESRQRGDDEPEL